MQQRKTYDLVSRLMLLTIQHQQVQLSVCLQSSILLNCHQELKNPSVSLASCLFFGHCPFSLLKFLCQHRLWPLRCHDVPRGSSSSSGPNTTTPWRSASLQSWLVPMVLSSYRLLSGNALNHRELLQSSQRGKQEEMFFASNMIQFHQNKW